MQQFTYATRGLGIRVAKDTDIYGDEFWSDKPGKDRSLGSCSSEEKKADVGIKIHYLSIDRSIDLSIHLSMYTYIHMCIVRVISLLWYVIFKQCSVHCCNNVITIINHLKCWQTWVLESPIGWPWTLPPLQLCQGLMIKNHGSCLTKCVVGDKLVDYVDRKWISIRSAAMKVDVRRAWHHQWH